MHAYFIRMIHINGWSLHTERKKKQLKEFFPFDSFHLVYIFYVCEKKKTKLFFLIEIDFQQMFV